jgi:hypothetical protein
MKLKKFENIIILLIILLENMTIIKLPNNQTLNINLADYGSSFKKYLDGSYKLGLISDNPEIIDENSIHYEEVNIENDNTKKKCFKNKIRVKLLDNNYLTAHLIHWVPSDGYFFVTQDKFWDKFDNENNNNLDEKSE